MPKALLHDFYRLTFKLAQSTTSWARIGVYAVPAGEGPLQVEFMGHSGRAPTCSDALEHQLQNRSAEKAPNRAIKNTTMYSYCLHLCVYFLRVCVCVNVHQNIWVCVDTLANKLINK